MLSEKFQRAQKSVHKIIGTYFENLSETFAHQSFDLVSLIIDNKNLQVEQNNFWQISVGKYIQTAGVEQFLGKFPLKIHLVSLKHPDFEELSNSWILPLFRKFLKSGELVSFFKHFLPISNVIHGKLSNQMAEEGGDLEKKQLEILFFQIWDLFPIFTKTLKPKIAAETLQILEIAPIILTKFPRIRSQFCSGLRNISISLAQRQVITPENLKIKNQFAANVQKLIPKLVKLFDPDNQKTLCVLRLISAFMLICSEKWLRKVIEHNQTKILKQLTEKTTNSLTLKNLEILIHAYQGFDFNWHDFQTAIKFIEAFLGKGKGKLLQKKAYSILLVLIQRTSDAKWHQVVVKCLSQNKTCEVISRGVRLKVLNKTLDVVKVDKDLAQWLQIFLPEIILSFKDSNQKTRKISAALIHKICVMSKPVIKELVTSILGGFAGETSLIKSSTVYVISFMLEMKDIEIGYEIARDVNELIGLLLQEQNSEIYKSYFTFLKAYHKLIPKDEKEPEIQKILINLLTVDPISSQNFKAQIRFLILRFVKKLSQEKIEEIIPQNHKNMVKYIIKQEKLAKKKKLKEKEERENQGRLRSMYKKKMIDVEENEEYDTLQEHMDHQHIMGSSNLLLKFDHDREIFHFIEQPLKQPKKEEASTEEAPARKEDVYFDQITRKIVVREKQPVILGRKRRRNDDPESKQIESEAKQGQLQIMKAFTDQLKRKRLMRKDIHFIKESGQQYKAKDAGGDIILKNRPLPYSFIQLNPKAMNKRFRKRAEKQLRSFTVHQKQHGSLAGLKQILKKK